MSRELLSQGDGLQLVLVASDDEEAMAPFRFDTICLGCGQVVASTTYTPQDQEDPRMEARIDQDSRANLLVAKSHQVTCRGLKESSSLQGGRH